MKEYNRIMELIKEIYLDKKDDLDFIIVSLQQARLNCLDKEFQEECLPIAMRMREVIESSPAIAQVMNQVPEAQYLHSEFLCFEALGNIKKDLAKACEKIKLARAIIMASFPDETAPHFKYEVVEMQLAMSLNNTNAATLNEVYKYRVRLEEIKEHINMLKFQNNTLVNLVQRLEPSYLGDLSFEI